MRTELFSRRRVPIKGDYCIGFADYDAIEAGKVIFHHLTFRLSDGKLPILVLYDE